VQPVIRRLEDDPVLLSDRAAWRERRARMCQRLEARDPVALQDPWDKDYFVGRYADGRPTGATHVHKLRLRSPRDDRV
jgi:hypothetical protein